MGEPLSEVIIEQQLGGVISKKFVRMTRRKARKSSDCAADFKDLMFPRLPRVCLTLSRDGELSLVANPMDSELPSALTGRGRFKLDDLSSHR